MKDKDENKERLNSILRLRLFFSTEKELGNEVGLSLKGNHFNRLKAFASEAFFSKFAKDCNIRTNGKVNLAWLLSQYETTSKFFKQYIEGTGHEKNKHFIPYLLNHIFMDETPNDGTQHLKDIKLCERYDDYNKEDKMNVGILILMTYGLISTFKNKTWQDVPNIIADYEKAYDLLFEIAQSNQSGASIKYKEIPCLKEMHKLIEEEKEGENYLNRLLLIYFTNDVLNRIFALKNPEILRQLCNENVPKDFELPRLWRCDDDASNIVWEFVKLDIDKISSYYLFRKEIDYKNKKIHFTRYQLTFMYMGDKDFCYTQIMRPSFQWYNILQREQPNDSQSFDYTNIEYEDGIHTAKQLTFTMESPVGEKPMTLKTIKDNETQNYTTCLDHKGYACDFEDDDNEPQYAITFNKIEVATSYTVILFNFGDVNYKLDKFDEDGNETISGISSLKHDDNFVLAELNDGSQKRLFLCLDSINQFLDLDDLFEKPYFHRIEQVSDII